MLSKPVRWLKKLVLICWLLAVCVLGAWLAVDNGQSLSLSVIGLQLPELTAGVYMALIFAFGVLVGLVTSYLSFQKKALSRKRALNKANKEVARLRKQPVES